MTRTRWIILGLLALASMLLMCCIAISAIALLSSPKYDRWTSTQVVSAFQSSGLTIESPRPFAESDYNSLMPRVVKEGILFSIPSPSSQSISGSYILSFSSAADLNRMQDYLRQYCSAFKEKASTCLQWIFIRDNILVKINGDLPEPWARQYETVLNAMPQVAQLAPLPTLAPSPTRTLYPAPARLATLAPLPAITALPTPSRPATIKPIPTSTPPPTPARPATTLPPTPKPAVSSASSSAESSCTVRTGAVCNDGTTSTATGQGACSGHGGVKYWTCR